MAKKYIDQAELISRIESEYRKWGDDYDAEQILGDIEDMPAADVAPQWIPVTERLPEEHEEVLTYNPVFGITFDSLHNGKWRKHPIAWMPLPEPYKEGDAE